MIQNNTKAQHEKKQTSSIINTGQKKNETVKGEGRGKENNKLKLSGVTGVELKSFA